MSAPPRLSLTQLLVAVKQVSQVQPSVADGEFYVETLDAVVLVAAYGDVFPLHRAGGVYVG